MKLNRLDLQRRGVWLVSQVRSVTALRLGVGAAFALHALRGVIPLGHAVDVVLAAVAALAIWIRVEPQRSVGFASGVPAVIRPLRRVRDRARRVEPITGTTALVR